MLFCLLIWTSKKGLATASNLIHPSRCYLLQMEHLWRSPLCGQALGQPGIIVMIRPFELEQADTAACEFKCVSGIADVFSVSRLYSSCRIHQRLLYYVAVAVLLRRRQGERAVLLQWCFDVALVVSRQGYRLRVWRNLDCGLLQCIDLRKAMRNLSLTLKKNKLP